MADQDKGLGDVQSLARGVEDVDAEFERRMTRARAGLRQGLREMEEGVAELRESVEELAPSNVTPIRQEQARVHNLPRAAVEFTEDELRAVLRCMNDSPGEPVSEEHTAHEKLSQALTVESGPGGAFFDSPGAA